MTPVLLAPETLSETFTLLRPIHPELALRVRNALQASTASGLPASGLPASGPPEDTDQAVLSNAVIHEVVQALSNLSHASDALTEAELLQTRRLLLCWMTPQP